MVLVVKESIVAWWSHWHPVEDHVLTLCVLPAENFTERRRSYPSILQLSPFLYCLIGSGHWAGLRKSFFLNRKSPLQTLWTPSWYMLLHQLWLKLIIRCTQCLEIAFSSNPKKSCLYPSLWGIYSAYLKSLGLIQILVFEMSWWTQRPPLCFDHHQVFVIFA